MTVQQPVPYLSPWDTVPLAFLDFETTGAIPGRDRVVQVAIVRFEGGAVVGSAASLINPGMPIPEAASAIHGIRDEQVAGAPTLDNFFLSAAASGLLLHAQPGAYNAPFDKLFCPPWALSDWAWPWLDTMVLVTAVDEYVKGAGRYKLENAAKRHGIEIGLAHDASNDARAAGQLFHRLMPECFTGPDARPCIGELLRWTRVQEANRWGNFHEWVATEQRAKDASA